MATVTVKYLGNFSLITRKRQEEIAVSENENISSLMSRLSHKYGREFEKAFDNPMAVVWVNEKVCDKEKVLHHGDKLTLYPGDRLIIGILAGGG